MVTDEEAAGRIGAGALPAGTRLAVGPDALDDLVRADGVDRVVSAIVGAAGFGASGAAAARPWTWPPASIRSVISKISDWGLRCSNKR